MATFKVRCASCDRRLGLGEDWVPAHRDGSFECTGCASRRTHVGVRLVNATAAPPRHVLGSLRSNLR